MSKQFVPKTLIIFIHHIRQEKMQLSVGIPITENAANIQTFDTLPYEIGD